MKKYIINGDKKLFDELVALGEIFDTIRHFSRSFASIVQNDIETDEEQLREYMTLLETHLKMVDKITENYKMEFKLLRNAVLRHIIKCTKENKLHA